jgi:undecaprenyl-diphosphatase
MGCRVSGADALLDPFAFELCSRSNPGPAVLSCFFWRDPKMTLIHAILMAILQGATELFPVSSLGHAVVAPAVLHWNIDQRAPSFLPFLVMLHLGTATALLLFFRRDWWSFVRGVLGADTPDRVAENRHLIGLIVVATIPGVAVGLFLEHFFRSLFGNPSVAAVFLIVNGALLLGGERLRAQSGQRSLASLTIRDAFAVGCWQCTALIPGISRSGATMVGGLLRGINHEDAAHFSFLIATPIIAGATVLEAPKLLRAGVPPGILADAVLAAIVAGVTAFASTAFLMHYFRDRDRWALNPFAYYCILVGLGSLVALLVA